MVRKTHASKLESSSEKAHKLLPALVPGPLQGRSVYNELKNTKRRKVWDTLRRIVLEEAANTCAHCRATYESHMVCHEVWDYDEQNEMATLKTFDIVCRDCDSVLHFGKSLMIGGERSDQALKHMMKVNGITKKQGMSLIDEAFGVWNERSKRKTWQIRIAQGLIDKHPVLAGLKL